MKTVRAEDLLPGMVLAEPLKDLAGRTLLKEGAELTAGYIDRIQKWGFDDVSVQGGDEQPEALPPVVGYPVEGRSWDEVRAEVERRFSKAGGDLVMVRVKQAVLARVKQLADIHALR